MTKLDEGTDWMKRVRAARVDYDQDVLLALKRFHERMLALKREAEDEKYDRLENTKGVYGDVLDTLMELLENEKV